MRHNKLHTDPIHLVYRLSGSIPAAKLTQLKNKYKAAREELDERFSFAAQRPDHPAYKLFRSTAEKLEEAHLQAYEELIHEKNNGPMFLSEAGAQKIIIDSWRYIAQDLNISVYIICVMSNHVHVILRGNAEDCNIDLEKLLVNHKKFTATRINKLANTKGRRVWAEDFFDRDIRRGTFTTVFWYVLKNPVVAKIVSNPFEYSGTWFDPRMEQEYVRPYRHKWL